MGLHYGSCCALTSCRYTFKWVIKWYHSISLIFTFTTLLRIKTIFGDPEPWSQLDSSLWGSKNLLLCSECQAKWRCCLGGLDGKGYWNPLATTQQRSSKYPISILEEGNVFTISRSPRHRDQWKARGATTRLSSLYQVNDIALGTRILWIMFIWPLSGLAHRSQITVLAYRKAWPVDRGKIEVDLWALRWWHGHRFENLKWTDGGTAGLSGSQPILSRRCW